MVNIEKILEEYGTKGDSQLYIHGAKELIDGKMLHEAASVIDRAYCIEPSNREICLIRQNLLDQLSMTEHGIEFRYIPAGTYLMGSEHGDSDESPAHPVFVSAFWMSAVPLSWETICNIYGIGIPPEIDFEKLRKEDSKSVERYLFLVYKIILQYCEDQTLHARDWHCHVPPSQRNEKHSSMFKEPERMNPNLPYTYRDKPVVALDWHECSKICRKLTEGKEQQYVLATEAEWEKAARGGLCGKTYAWGDESPKQRADYGRFEQFSILPSKTFSPNGYGLYAMCGGVSEWVQDWYDAKYYSESPAKNPMGPDNGQEKIIRGGSWGDCSEACTVSFRSAQRIRLENQERGSVVSPNIGFRICRKVHNKAVGLNP